jgi:PAS domain S-box-containing protein
MSLGHPDAQKRAGNKPDTYRVWRKQAWPLLRARGLIDNSNRRSRSIRSRLLQIVFILIAPALIGLLAVASGFYENEREQISKSVFSTARTLASALDRDLAGTMAAARVLAESPFLATDDLAGFHREATRNLPLFPGFAIVLSDAAGQQLVHTFRSYGEPLPTAAIQSNQRKVFETGQPSVSDLFIGTITKKPALFVYVPVLRNNQVKYSLGVAIHLSRLNDLLSRQQLPPGWASAILDSANVIVAHSRVPELVGTIAPARPSAVMPTTSDLIETIRSDGTPIFVGFSKSEVSDWTVGVSVPIAEVSRQPNAVLLYGGLGVLGLLVAGLILAAFESARIGRAVQDLIAPALALGRGEAPVIPPLSIRECDDVAQALDCAHQLLQKRTLERDSAELNISERSLADEMFRLAVEACPNGMVMIDADGKIVMANSEIEQQFGYRRDELIGQAVDILVPERLRSQHACHRRDYVPKPEPRRMGAGLDLFGRRKDGTEFPVEVGLNPIRAREGLMVLSVIVDISQRKQAERLKDEFVATVSHELRTPLTSISGSLGLLAGRWASELPESAARLLTIAHTNSQRLVRLVNDILDIERIESGHVVFNLSKIAVRSLVEGSIEDNRGFAASYGVQVRFDAASADVDVNVDPDRLAQVVTNLLSNAIKFSPADGEVLIAVERNENNVRITVRDHGSGIPDDFKLHIFEKFAQADATNTRKKGGTGLGLSIVKQIVERLGGEVGFEDATGGGTTFYVDLPVWDGRAGGEIDLDSEAAEVRVLLCEEDRAVATVVRERMRRAGFAVDFAHTVAAALARTNTTRYAAILVDRQLPDGDGIGLIVRLRAQAHTRDTPVIVISGDPEQGRNDVRSSRLNVLRWLGKPIAFKPLIELLKAATALPLQRRPRILHVDDDYDVLAMVNHELSSMADVISVDCAESALRTLATDRIDLVVLDLRLGEDSGLDLLPDLRDSAGNVIPVIIFSSYCADAGCDGKVNSTLSKMNSSLESLGAAVRDRLALLPAQLAKEIA